MTTRIKPAQIAMERQNTLLAREFEKAAKATVISETLQHLDKFRITTDTKVQEEEFLMRMYGRPCFPRGDLSAITGVEKCGKTIFTSMIMACCAQRSVLELERIQEAPLKAMWYDTEQSTSSTKGILTDRIAKMVEGDFPEANFFVFNVRSCSFQERLEMLAEGIATYKPDIVIIDNVSDLLSSINDPDASQKVIEQLMAIATMNHCNISVVIHLNRTGEKRNLRGWLGTEILHKAYEVYNCEQPPMTDVFLVEQTMTRKYRITETLYYKMSDEGLPVATSKPDFQQRDTQGRFTSNKPEAYHVSAETVDSFCQAYIIRHPDNARRSWEWNLRLLFGKAMGDRAMMDREDLQHEVMALSGIRFEKYYDKVFQMALDRRVVKTTLDTKGRVVVIPLPA